MKQSRPSQAKPNDDAPDSGASSSAYGGSSWSPRTATLAAEMGSLWGDWGTASEVAPLEAVMLHRPGPELAQPDPDAAQHLAPLDWRRAQAEHDALADAYRAAGVAVHYLPPVSDPSPNMMFMADLSWMTPEGAVLARPASTVRAGEERHVQAALAALGVPILRGIRGAGVFEGADAMWLDSSTVLMARGLRTNPEGATQVAALLVEMGIQVLSTDLPPGTMHLMGSLRLLAPDLALIWPGKIMAATVAQLRERGLSVLELPDHVEGRRMAMNGVTLAPGRFLAPANCPHLLELLTAHGIECQTVEVGELAKAAGGIGCLTAVLKRSGGKAA